SSTGTAGDDPPQSLSAVAEGASSPLPPRRTTTPTTPTTSTSTAATSTPRPARRFPPAIVLPQDLATGRYWVTRHVVPVAATPRSMPVPSAKVTRTAP